eukprot:gnl/MRDRNA2_/MRDRNA2_85290_c0_seq1.p1 gnl/MRDRNA2_/MRDRNA2_85290_c0~~gnl/MRDRNA2_/MRDRNA2_85290_c0_seq1.p1  ORF type:complete len:590 (-),score=100.54 gnl/MRDRNA2_/MRDRNA2_85290_c0_seq1:134-1903(-)
MQRGTFVLLVLLSSPLGIQAAGAKKELNCQDGGCLRREDLGIASSLLGSSATSKLHNNAGTSVINHHWHSLQNWGGVKTRQSDEEFNDGDGNFPPSSVSMPIFHLKSMWANSRAECIAVLLILVTLMAFFTVKAAMTMPKESEGPVIPLSTTEVFGKGLIICVPCLAAGYNLAIVGADVQSIQLEFGITADMVGWVASLACIGCIVGAMLNASFVDFVGRKTMHSYLTLMLFFGQLLMFAAPTFPAFLIGRFIMGTACGGLTALAPMYLAELAPRKQRGLLVSITEQGISGGLLFGFAAAAFQSWGFREHSLAGLCFPVVTLALATRLAESPRWLITKGRIEEATVILQRYMPDAEEVKHTLKAASECVSVNDAKRPSLLETIGSFATLLNRNKQQLFAPALLMVLEEVVGIEVSDDYCVQFLREAGVPHRSIVATATTAMVAMKAIVLIISGHLLDSWGRKPSLLFSLGGQVVCLAAFAYFFGSGPWQATLAFWIMYNLFYGAGLGNVCMVVMAEAFPDAKVRGMGCAFCYILNRLVAAIMSGIFPWQQSAMGVANVFYLWSASAFAAFVLTVVFMKESSGVMLEHAG